MRDKVHVFHVFETIFGKGAEEIKVFFAPGRVNLIGEHTDYTGGYVLPASLSLGTWAVVRPRKDRFVRLASTHFNPLVEFPLDEIEYRPEDKWANYPKGVIKELLVHGASLSGCEILFHGNIPTQAGLSSSASIELVTAVALQSIFALPVTMLQLIKLCQQAENQFVGMKCGIMDQFAIGMGKKEQAILLNCATLEYEYVPVQLKDSKLVITNTNKSRQLAKSPYNERRRECEHGFKLIQKEIPTLQYLGELEVADWKKVQFSIPSATLRKRIEHIVTENERVLASKKALIQGDLAAFGSLLNQSHLSLRDNYEVTGLELDVLVEEALQADGCMGSRMTGAGFGGCTISLVDEQLVDTFIAQVRAGYEQRTGLKPTFYICQIDHGAKEVSREEIACLF